MSALKILQHTVQWCREMLALSPMALRCLKAAMNADCDGQVGLLVVAGLDGALGLAAGLLGPLEIDLRRERLALDVGQGQRRKRRDLRSCAGADRHVPRLVSGREHLGHLHTHPGERGHGEEAPIVELGVAATPADQLVVLARVHLVGGAVRRAAGVAARSVANAASRSSSTTRPARCRWC